MKEFLYVVGVFWVTAGSCLILYTVETKSLIGSMQKGLDRRILAGLAAVFGVLLILAAPECRNTWFVRLIGFLGVAKGAFIFSNPHGLYDRMTNWVLDTASDQTLRLFGIMALMLGTALFSWIM